MTEQKPLKHDQLQNACHIWMWNNHPELRQLFSGTFNDIKTVEKRLGPLPSRVRIIILSKMKSLGMAKGILDYQFYYAGVFHILDFKVGKDKLSPEQKLTIKRVEEQGGKGYEIRSLEQFQLIIKKIIS